MSKLYINWKILLLISLFSSNVFAQNKLISFKVGYGFMLANSSEASSTFSNGKKTMNTIDFSLGKGINMEGSFLYMFNKNIGLDLGLACLIGQATVFTEENATLIQKQQLSANMIKFIPAVLITTGTEKMSPYAKFGLIISSGLITDEMESNYATGDYKNVKYSASGGVAFGFESNLGINYNYSEKYLFFGEVSVISLSYAPSNSEMVVCNLNGNNMLPKLTVREKNIEYVDSYVDDIKQPINTAEPEKRLKNYQPFSSIGLNIGIRYKF